MKTLTTPVFPLLLSLIAAWVVPATGLDQSAPAAEPTGAIPHHSSQGKVPQGIAKSDWRNIRAAYEARRHAFEPFEKGWQARNPGQSWTAEFDGRGFITRPGNGGWTWGLELQSYGLGPNQQTIQGTPVVRTEDRRLSYQWDAIVQEWFINDPRGLEHGFTLTRRPPTGEHHATGPGNKSLLSFTLVTRGTLRPVITADARSLKFIDERGATGVNYSGLKVWDADGRLLDSHFEPAGERQVRLMVDEAAARYPITIDPVAQQAYLKASNTGASDLFGTAVAVSGDTVVVGAPRENSSTTGVNSTPDNAAAASGAAYVFVRNGTTWTQQAYLKAGNTGVEDWFGATVGISGDTIIIGARWEDGGGTGVNPEPNDLADNAGAAYIFVRGAGTWTQQAYLKGGNTGTADMFGTAVGISGDIAVVGATGEDGSGTGVNSPSNENANRSGAAYIFVRIGGTWTQQAYLKASNTGLTDVFGSAVAVSHETVVVGTYEEDSSSTGVNSIPNDNANAAGAAYVFARHAGVWTQEAYLKASNAEAGDYFGWSVAVSDDTVIVGAREEDGTPNESAHASGAAYVFVRAPGSWIQQAYLKAGNPDINDRFGYAVAVSGDTAVVGALYEDSLTTGVNSTPDDSEGWNIDSGAAYVYGRSTGLWTQQAYLKGTTTGAGDFFGTAVAVSGDTVVVGATYEASSTTGVDSLPDENATGAGAAYSFTLSATQLESWRQLYFGTSANDGSAANWSDPDHDGLINLIEFAFGLNPTSGSSRQLPAGQQIGNQFVVTFQQPAAVTGIVYEAEWSPTMDAASWAPVPDSGNGTTHTFSVPVGPGPEKFIRLIVREQ